MNCVESVLTPPKQACGYKEEKNLVLDHIHALRQNPFTRDSEILFGPENSMGHSIGHIWNGIRKKFDNVSTFFTKVDGFQKPYGDPGMVTTNKGKIDYANSFRNHVNRGTLLIAKDLVVANRYMDPRTRTEETFNKFLRQVRQYRIIVQPALNATGKDKTTVSGVIDKYGKPNPTANDDIMMIATYNTFCGDCAMDRTLPYFDHKNVP